MASAEGVSQRTERVLSGSSTSARAARGYVLKSLGSVVPRHLVLSQLSCEPFLHHCAAMMLCAAVRRIPRTVPRARAVPRSREPAVRRFAALPIVPIVASGLSRAAQVVVRLEPIAPSTCVRGAVA